MSWISLYAFYQSLWIQFIQNKSSYNKEKGGRFITFLRGYFVQNTVLGTTPAVPDFTGSLPQLWEGAPLAPPSCGWETWGLERYRNFSWATGLISDRTMTGSHVRLSEMRPLCTAPSCHQHWCNNDRIRRSNIDEEYRKTSIFLWLLNRLCMIEVH